MKTKKIISIILTIVTLMTVLCVGTISASAATAFSSSNTAPSSSDYVYWNGSKMVKSSAMNASKIKYIQQFLNWCIDNGKISSANLKAYGASRLSVDGSFGPASKKMTQAFQKQNNLTVDGSFGPATIKKMSSVLADSNSNKGDASNNNSNNKIVSPITNRSISSPFQPYYRWDRTSSSWAHMGIDYTGGSNVWAFYEGTVTRVWYNSSSGNSIEIKHVYAGKTFYSYYFHLKDKSINVKVNDKVSTGQSLATMGTTGGSTGVHLHFQITDKSVVNSKGSISVAPNNANNKAKWTKAAQSNLYKFTYNGTVWYNPEKVLTEGLSVIIG